MKAEELASRSKKELLEIAKKLDIAGRSSLSKEDLVRAIQKGTAAGRKPAKAAQRSW